jgi:hypothetical protein
MNFYEEMLKKIVDGRMSKLSIAMLSIIYYVIGSKGMTADNLADIMSKLGYTYNTSTNVLNDGTTDYTVYDLLNKVITDLYPIDEILYPATMENILWVAHTHKDSSGALYISDEQFTMLEGKL